MMGLQSMLECQLWNAIIHKNVFIKCVCMYTMDRQWCSSERLLKDAEVFFKLLRGFSGHLSIERAPSEAVKTPRGLFSWHYRRSTVYTGKFWRDFHRFFIKSQFIYFFYIKTSNNSFFLTWGKCNVFSDKIVHLFSTKTLEHTGWILQIWKQYCMQYYSQFTLSK